MIRTLSTAVAAMAFAALSTSDLRADGSGNSKTAKARVDLRPAFQKLGLVQKHQGHRNTCSVFTTVGAMEFAVSRKFGRGTPLSEEFLNWACNQVIGNDKHDRGQFFHDLLKGFQKHGICRGSEMPYAAKFHPEYEPSARALESAKRVSLLGLKAHWIKQNDQTVGIDETHMRAIKKALRAGWPVCGGSSHSVLLVGYEEDTSLPGGGRFFVRDSRNPRNPPMSFKVAKARLCDLLWYEIPLAEER